MPRAGWVVWAIPAAVTAWVLAVPALDPVRGGPGPVAPPPPPAAESEPVSEDSPSIRGDLAAVRYEGRPAAGLQVTLRVTPRTREPLALRWVQTGGPPIALDDPTSPEARFIVPADSGLIELVLVVGDGRRVSTRRLTIPVEAGPVPGLKADAGDDQLGRVGHRVTLNGLRSEPHGRIGFRWVQVGGPEAALPVAEGAVFSFVPTAPGTYRFALVVATGGSISLPDVVEVAVVAAEDPSPPPTAPAAAAQSVPTLSQAAASALAALPGGREVGPELAEAFEATAERIDLYATYEELYAELSRRLEPLLPAEPAARQAWERGLFAPLSAPLVELARPYGVDLRTPEGFRSPLGDGLKRRIAGHFREIAAGFRPGGAEGENTDQARPAAPARSARGNREDDR